MRLTVILTPACLERAEIHVLCSPKVVNAFRHAKAGSPKHTVCYAFVVIVVFGNDGSFTAGDCWGIPSILTKSWTLPVLLKIEIELPKI